MTTVGDLIKAFNGHVRYLGNLSESSVTGYHRRQLDYINGEPLPGRLRLAHSGNLSFRPEYDKEREIQTLAVMLK